MFRSIKKYLAIRAFVRRLSQDLGRRFGKKAFYRIDQVTGASERSGFSQEFIAYAHAAFCSRESYEDHYGGAADYLDRRRPIAKRYFDRDMDFNATDAIRKFQPVRMEGDFTESDLGEDNL